MGGRWESMWKTPLFLSEKINTFNSNVASDTWFEIQWLLFKTCNSF